MNVNFGVTDVTNPLVAWRVAEAWNDSCDGTSRELRDSQARDKATRRQPRTGALKRCLLDASVERRN